MIAFVHLQTFINWVTTLCTRLRHTQRAQLRCSSLWAAAHCVVSPCWTRRARHTRPHPAVFS